MNKTTHILLVLVVLAAGAAAQSGEDFLRRATNPGVRGSFVYCGPDPNCEAGNRVRQDSTFDYVHGSEGVEAVFNIVSGSRDLTFNLLTSQRKVELDFSVLVNTGAVSPAWLSSSPVQLVKAGINVRGAYYAKENCPAESAECHYTGQMAIGSWKVANDTSSYAAFWNPLATNRPVNSPDTTSYVDVHYIRNDGNGEVFIITPILTGAGYALSGLEQVNKRVVRGAGQYNMPFTLKVRPL